MEDGSSTRRVEIVESVARMVPGPSDAGCVRIGVDGVDGAGKSTFAAELAAALRATGRPVVHVSADGFLNPRSVRHRRGRRSPMGFWLDSYDYRALAAEVLAPFGPGGSRRYRSAVHDLDSDAPVNGPVHTAPPGSVLVVDGLFLHREELEGAWDLSVFLHVPFDVTARRMADRDGTHPDPEHSSMSRYVEGQRLYFAARRPWERADVVVDNSDPARPCITRSRADSC